MRYGKGLNPAGAWLLPGTSPESPAPTYRGGIPRILHQTFSARNRLPQVLADNCRAIEALNPDFEYRFYEDRDCESFVKETFGQAVLERYLRIHPSYGAARVDLYRYLCLCHFGGAISTSEPA